LLLTQAFSRSLACWIAALGVALAPCGSAQAWDDAEDAALETIYPGEEPPTEPVLGPAEDPD